MHLFSEYKKIILSLSLAVITAVSVGALFAMPVNAGRGDGLDISVDNTRIQPEVSMDGNIAKLYSDKGVAMYYFLGGGPFALNDSTVRQVVVTKVDDKGNALETMMRSGSTPGVPIAAGYTVTYSGSTVQIRNLDPYSFYKVKVVIDDSFSNDVEDRLNDIEAFCKQSGYLPNDQVPESVQKKIENSEFNDRRICSIAGQGDMPNEFLPRERVTQTSTLQLESGVKRATPSELNVETEQVAPPAGGGQGEGDTDEVACVIENSLGWIICPLSVAMGKVTLAVANFIEGLLRTQPLPLNAPGLENNDPDKAIYLIWSQVRNIANIVLVIALIAVIYSQATSAGLSNYGVKKMLPRLVAASILINISYFLCALALDVFNLLGSGIAGIFTIANNSIPLLDKDATLGTVVGQAFATLGLAGLGAGAVVAGGYTTWGAIWPIIVPVLVALTLAIIAVFAVLTFRLVAIILLVIISPLAFAAWILPNTEGYFKKWWGFLQNLLVMYPLIMGIIYGSILASNLIQNVVAESLSDGTASGEIGAAVAPVLGLMALAIPLFALPFLFKLAGGIGNRLGLAINNPNKGLIDRSRKWSRARSGEEREANRLKTRAALGEKFGENYGRNSRLRKYTGAGIVGRQLGRSVRGDRAEELKASKELSEARLKAMQQERGAVDGSLLSQLDDEKFAAEQRAASAQRAQQEQLAHRLASSKPEDIDFRRRAAGIAGTAGVSRVQAYGESILEKAEKEEAEILAQRFAKQGTSVDELSKLATAESSTAAQRRAALDVLAKGGSIGELRKVRQELEARAPRTATGEVVFTPELQTYNTVLNSNPSIFGGAPDLNPAHGHKYDGFGKLSAQKVAGWHNTTLEAAAKDAAGDPVKTERLLSAFNDAMSDSRIAPGLDNRQVVEMLKFFEAVGATPPPLATSGTTRLKPSETGSPPAAGAPPAGPGSPGSSVPPREPRTPSSSDFPSDEEGRRGPE